MPVDIGYFVQRKKHPDPESLPAPDRRAWSPVQTAAFASPEMELYRAALLTEEIREVRSAALDDLGAYFDRGYFDRRQRPEEDPCPAWSVNLLWYAHLQAEGHAYPMSTVIARRARDLAPLGEHLDFGSGAGLTSQLFRALGYDTTLADLPELLSFARFRLERRGLRARYIDLTRDSLPTARYDVVTAIDTLMFVPDLASTARKLRRAMRSGGVLFANFDVGPMSENGGWPVQERRVARLRWQLQRAGFERESWLDGVGVYRAVAMQGASHALRGARDAVLLLNPLRPLLRPLRRYARGLRHFA